MSEPQTFATLKFNTTALKTGRQSKKYQDKLDVKGGCAPVLITVDKISIRSKPSESLEAAGISLGLDGTIYGIPLVSGVISFTVTATSADNQIKSAVFSIIVEEPSTLFQTLNTFNTWMVAIALLIISSPPILLNLAPVLRYWKPELVNEAPELFQRQNPGLIALGTVILTYAFMFLVYRLWQAKLFGENRSQFQIDEEFSKHFNEHLLEADENVKEDRFDRAFRRISNMVGIQILAHNKKASLQLERGMAFAQIGICWLIVSIVVWQVVGRITAPPPALTVNVLGSSTPVFKFESISDGTIFALVGIASSGFLFIFLEIFSYWCFSQHRNNLDLTVYLTKVRVLIDRYRLAYSYLREEGFKGREAGEQMLNLLQKDIRWPDVLIGKQRDLKPFMEIIDNLTDVIGKEKEQLEEVRKATSVLVKSE